MVSKSVSLSVCVSVCMFVCLPVGISLELHVVLLSKKSLEYNEVLVRQGQPINSVYFILRSVANTHGVRGVHVCVTWTGVIKFFDNNYPLR